jgi:hypothetical protein
MGSMATASNDPIFFLHHCFIDLMGRQWQVRGPPAEGTTGPGQSAGGPRGSAAGGPRAIPDA